MNPFIVLNSLDATPAPPVQSTSPAIQQPSTTAFEGCDCAGFCRCSSPCKPDDFEQPFVPVLAWW